MPAELRSRKSDKTNLASGLLRSSVTRMLWIPEAARDEFDARLPHVSPPAPKTNSQAITVPGVSCSRWQRRSRDSNRSTVRSGGPGRLLIRRRVRFTANLRAEFRFIPAGPGHQVTLAGSQPCKLGE